MELVDYSSSIYSIIPALLAIILAIATRRVLVSLSAGIIVGALMLVDFNPLNALIYLKDNVVALVYSSEEGMNSNMNIVFFLVLLGVLTALLTVSGSNRAFAEWAQNKIKGRRGAKLLAASLVFVTFIDDYFHSLAVGAIARPVTDRFKVSRAKLAYILDSTAAPMCVMMPVSSWGAYIITLVAGLLATYSITSYTPMGAFVAMSSMNYYAIFSLLMVRWASRTFFDDLLEAGVKIYHFEAGLLHTKSVLIDNKLALVGTVNMDLRSFLLNFEITVAVEDRNFANEVATLHENYLANSSALNMQEWINRPFYHRIIERLFFLFSPLL